MWSTTTGREIARIRLSSDCDYVRSVGFSADGKCIFAGTEEGQVIIVRAPNRSQ